MRTDIYIGETKIPFEATAMTDHMADKVFNINIAYSMQHATENEDKMPELIRKIAFIMAKRAELGGWRAVENLTEEDFFDWLDSLDSYEIENNAEEILGIYMQNKKTSVTPKNAQSPQVE